ncbi:hypothetical protein BVC71_04080 [Marivivens niveibacter]|uniref:Bifunctional NAD(P)H-hydrate repair enzyme n=2 Tax=Marivivens niveibacter TaxID=1930667 RepID=A0A251X384_9RHOB|nr:hypothetical protein BVC71_04080 [Marivivens niveibacter]
MRAAEQHEITAGRQSGADLMERAGRGVVDEIFKKWPKLALSSGTAIVVCGPGNNGGDGLVIARLLHDRGWDVTVFFYGDSGRLPPDARLNYDRWLKYGNVRPFAELKDFLTTIGDHNHPDLWIDAVFGTGLTRPIGGELAVGLSALSNWSSDLVSSHGGYVVAVEMPSGLNSDTGDMMIDRSSGDDGSGWYCDLAVTFHAPKRCHFVGQGPDLIDDLAVVDLGIRTNDFDAVRLVRPRAKTNMTTAGHKYTRGHVLVLGGPRHSTGAARLAARAALRSGAGLVTIAAPRDALDIYACHETEVMLRPMDSAQELQDMLQDARFDCLCLGPALGVETAVALMPTVLDADRYTVIDADAITALSRSTDLIGQLHAKCVLTPHSGEFARLCPDLVSEPKIDAAEAAAQRFGCTVLLKGRDTVIADPHFGTQLCASVYEDAAPWLGTAGAGDVLAGMIAGMRDPAQAAWVHAQAARNFGVGLIASDLPDTIPAVLQSLWAETETPPR